MNNPRRSGTRINCEIPAALRVMGCSPSPGEECTIILANLQGCAARFDRPLGVGATVRLEDLPAGSADARVVNCISVEKGTNLWLLGLALDEPGNVWGIESPPEDWYADISMTASGTSLSVRAV